VKEDAGLAGPREVMAMSRVRMRRGVFDSTMAYARWGEGAKTVLFLPGGPGNTLPQGPLRVVGGRLFRPLVDVGYTVWAVTRPRNLPDGYRIEDMADDYAAVIAAEFSGRVDIVIGSSMGGQIVQYLAANHPDCAETFVVLAAACSVPEWSKDLVRRQAAVVASGDRTARGLAAAEEMLPGRGLGWLRRLLVPLAARMWDWQTGPAEHEYFEHDYAVEADAEVRFDSREALPRIRVPVLLINGDRDRHVPKDMVERTAQLIPDCTVVWYPGKGHDATCGSRRLGPVILGYIRQRRARTSTP
jgi:pimeloyl-ACP methyl ester carboxylesterase